MAAATATSSNQITTPVSIASESFTVIMGTDTTITITPTVIKSIIDLSITPINSDAAVGGYYADNFVVGASSVSFVSQDSSNFIITIYGIIA